MGNGEQDAGAAAETEETGAAAEEQQQWDCDDDDESSQISQTEFHDCTNEFVGVRMKLCASLEEYQLILQLFRLQCGATGQKLYHGAPRRTR